MPASINRRIYEIARVHLDPEYIKYLDSDEPRHEKANRVVHMLYAHARELGEFQKEPMTGDELRYSEYCRSALMVWCQFFSLNYQSVNFVDNLNLLNDILTAENAQSTREN